MKLALRQVTAGPGLYSDATRPIKTRKTCRHGQPVVVLVDEYDKPILDNIDRPDSAAEIREGLFEVGLVFGRVERNLVQADWRAVGA